MHILEMYFSPPYDTILNRTVILEGEKEEAYFQVLEMLTKREKELLIKTQIKEA